MAEKSYKCNYSHCLHPDSKVLASESVVLGGKRYHWDCAATKQEINDIVNTYMSYIEDKTKRPIAMRAINSLVLKSGVPIEFIRKQVEGGKYYYQNKEPNALFGLKNLYFGYELKNSLGKW